MLTLSQQLLRLSAYNVWANTQFAELLNQVPPQWLDAEQKSSFSTLRLTAYHIWNGETVWLTRLKGTSLSAFPDRTGIHPSQFNEGAKELDAFLRTQPDAFFDGEIAYHTFDGRQFSTRLADVLQHLFNHATFHRGQLVTMLRGCGFEGKLPQTDFIAWQRIHG
ncbi:MAG: DinB family protein [Bacteroidia bacterium]|jgi:uncharacterized damage-inducible protein DinB|nr:DinB family protein [Bacteroidia bacterium]